MKIRNIQQIIFSLTMLVVALPLAAHPLSDTGLASGLLHPLLGIDHLLLILAVGVWAVQRNAKVNWRIPALFSIMLLAGVMLASSGTQLPFLEIFIASSILVLGLFISLQPAIRTSISMLVIGGFAVYHGYAHGQAIISGSISIGYMAGLWLSSTLLQIAGILLAVYVMRVNRRVIRWSGVSLIGVGTLLLLGL